MGDPGGPRAVLWDMDGTLVDSAAYHLTAWQETLAELGLAVTTERFLQTFGQRNDAVIRDLVDPAADAATIARIAQDKEARYRRFVREGGLDPLPGVLSWLEKLQTAGWRQAVASSAPHENIATILEVTGMEGWFTAIAGDEDVSRGKPDPQVYLVAASKLDAAPPRCVVVEDAPAGIGGGRRAGMHTIGVGSAHGPLAADIAVASLLDLADDAFARLVPES